MITKAGSKLLDFGLRARDRFSDGAVHQRANLAACVVTGQTETTVAEPLTVEGNEADARGKLSEHRTRELDHGWHVQE